MSVSLHKERRVVIKLKVMEKEGRRRVVQIQIAKITKKKIEKRNKRFSYVHATPNSIKLKQNWLLIAQKAIKDDMI
jgi:hypothetical protein